MDIIDLLACCSIKVPGGEQAGADTVPVTLKPGSKIARLALTPEHPFEFSRDAVLSFRIRFLDGEEAKLDVLKGDICFPEIHLESVDGEVFRFKRGNIKDFFDMRKLLQFQKISLPLGAFIHNIDMKSNTRASGNFFNKKIGKINFDFLNPLEKETRLEISGIAIAPSEKIIPSVFSFIDFSPVNTFPDSPLFVTESERVTFRVAQKDVANAMGLSDLRLAWRLCEAGNTEAGTVALGDTPGYLEIRLPRFGEHKVEFRMTARGQTVARTLVTAVRSRNMPRKSHSGMGISDGSNYGLIKRLGGEYQRRVVALNAILQDGKSFRFRKNLDVTPLFASTPGKWIVAFKTMPKFLQKDMPDAHRYGPNDMQLYERLLDWLIPQLVSAGIYAIEGWNEANVIHEWCDTPATLRDMQRCLFDAVKRHSTEVLVLSPSSTSWDFAYFETLSEAGVLNFADALAVHGYTYSPEEASSHFDELERIASANNLSVFLTEIGFRTPTFSTFDQASYFALYTLHAFFRERVKCILWFRYQNELPESFATYNQNSSTGYALLGYRGLYARGAFAAYRFLDFMLSSTVPGDIGKHANATVFRGSMEGRGLAAIHAEDGQFDLSRFENWKLYDIFGNTLKTRDLPSQKVIFLCERPLQLE